MKKKTIWFLLSILAILALILTACGGTTAEEPTSDAGTGGGGEEMSLDDTGTIFILGAFRGAEEDAFNSIVTAFEEKYPDIDVIYSGTAEFETLINIRVEAGDAELRGQGRP